MVGLDFLPSGFTLSNACVEKYWFVFTERNVGSDSESEW